MRHLLLQRSLQRVVIGVDYVLPSAKVAVVVVGKATVTVPGASELVRDRGPDRKYRSGITVDVLGAEDLMTGGADVIQFDSPLRQDLALNAQEVVVDIRVTHALREDDARQDGDVRI